MAERAKECPGPCVPCEGCRTINLALHNKGPKPQMQVQAPKCTPETICYPDYSTKMKPTCIRVITPEEYRIKFCAQRAPVPPAIPIGHGCGMYVVKAAIVAGVLYFSITQGIWGDQPEVTECFSRWQEYLRSVNSRIPPKYDPCGRVIRKDPPDSDSVLAPAYNAYKAFITNLFSGVVKFPMVIKCALLEYQAALDKREAELARARKFKK